VPQAGVTNEETTMHKQTFIATLTMSALAAGGIASAQMQQGKQAGMPSDKSGVYSATPIHSESMAALDRAAQRLRESIQSLAAKKEGPERDQAMDAANRALIDTQNAMIALPPEYRVAGIAVSNRPIVKANPAQNRTYGDSMKELQLASDRLRQAIQAMAQRPAGSGRDEAIKDAHAALFQTQQAMTLVPGMRPVATGAGAASDKVSAASDKSGVYSATAVHTESMNALVRAAQRLRESVQSLAQRPPGPERDKAMELAKKALLDTQQAMVALPAEYRVEGIVVSNKPIVKGDVAQNRTFGDSMKELQLASDRLHQAIQAMAQRPAGPERNDAIKQAHQALFQTQQALGMVPGPMASSPSAPHVSGGGKAPGASDAQQGSEASAGGASTQQGGAGGTGRK
jgi:hypothetical protein